MYGQWMNNPTRLTRRSLHSLASRGAAIRELTAVPS